MSVTEALHRGVAAGPGGVAAVDESGTLAWPALVERVARLAAALRGLGLRPGGRVALLALNGRRWLETFYAVAWTGGVLVPLNPRLASAELGWILADAEPDLLMLDAPGAEQHGDALRAAAPGRPAVLAEPGAAPAGWHAYEPLIAGAAPLRDAAVANGELAGLYYTGGTTGTPKGVMLSHGNLLANTGAAADFGPDTVYLHATPLYHVGGVRYLVAVTAAGGAHAFLPRFDPLEARRAIARWRGTATTLVPAALQAMLGGAAGQTGELASLRQLRYGGAAMPEPVILAAMELLPHCQFHQGYAMTETASVGTGLGPQHHTADPARRAQLCSAGLPAPGVEVRILDPAGAELPSGAVGEIALRGPQVMLGYWRRPELSAEALRGGWHHSGDLGTLDAEGFLHVVDRLKDMIVTNGENVYSAEVEQAVLRMPAVAQCAVFAIPHARWGEAVHAVVVPRPGESLTPRQVLLHCRALLAGFKCPRSVTVSQEPLPVGTGNKVRKAALRAPYWAGRARRVN